LILTLFVLVGLIGTSEVVMARKDSRDRGLFERTVGSGVYWIRFAGPDGREHMERGGTKSEARALYMRRRTEIHDGTEIAT
jgi:hypothetical protein